MPGGSGFAFGGSRLGARNCRFDLLPTSCPPSGGTLRGPAAGRTIDPRQHIRRARGSGDHLCHHLCDRHYRRPPFGFARCAVGHSAWRRGGLGRRSLPAAGIGSGESAGSDQRPAAGNRRIARRRGPPIDPVTGTVQRRRLRTGAALLRRSGHGAAARAIRLPPAPIMRASAASSPTISSRPSRLRT